jgi:two-component system sensor histidine kinase DesK
VVGGFTLAALSPVLTMRDLAIGTAVTTVVVVLGRALGGVGGLVGLGIAVFVAVLFLAGSFRLTVWILFVVRELDASRDVHARLAVAEERLRFSRDLHDVVGRALSAVAVKSELAAELARRGDERAVDEMLQVRTLAHDSLREVRGVVAGYRAADLATELAGARSVLRAAGVEARVVGDVPDLATPQAEALAWVVREAVTNVVRHSHAAACALRLDQEEGATALRVTNDGVRAVPREDAAGGPGGSGLAGLRERLAAVGGTLAVRHDGDRFTLTARVPTPDRHDPYALVAAEEGA